MKAFVITLFNDKYSLASAENTLKTARQMNDDLHIEMVRAVTPDKIKDTTYSYPDEGKTSTFMYPGYVSMTLVGYKAKDIGKKIACSLSHMHLWNKCVEMNEPIMILEHDAVFTRKFSYEHVRNKYRGILGLNDPRGATRKSQLFHELTRDKGEGVHDAPWIDDKSVPQGIAGNSAYIIKPHMAGKLIKQTFEIGMWPNDAVMCKQNFPNMLEVVYPYYTSLQGVKSTTQS